MEEKTMLAHNLSNPSKINRTFIIVLLVSLLAGTGTGYYLASSSQTGAKLTTPLTTQQAPKTAQQDNRTFRDFAEGKVAKKPESKNPNEYSEGTHILVRDGGNPVTLTSSVLDLSAYEGKKVKVYGETQKAIKAGWLMDVGKIEEIK